MGTFPRYNTVDGALASERDVGTCWTAEAPEVYTERTWVQDSAGPEWLQPCRIEYCQPDICRCDQPSLSIGSDYADKFDPGQKDSSGSGCQGNAVRYDSVRAAWGVQGARDRDCKGYRLIDPIPRGSHVHRWAVQSVESG